MIGIAFNSAYQMHQVFSDLQRANAYSQSAVVAGLLAIFAFIFSKIYKNLNFPRLLKYIVFALAGLSIALYLFSLLPALVEHKEKKAAIDEIIKGAEADDALEMLLNDDGKHQSIPSVITDANNNQKQDSMFAFMQLLKNPYLNVFIFCFVELLCLSALHFYIEELLMSNNKSMLENKLRSLYENKKEIKAKLKGRRNSVGMSDVILRPSDFKRDYIIHNIDHELSDLREEARGINEKLVDLTANNQNVKAFPVKELLMDINMFRQDLLIPETLERIHNDLFEKFKLFGEQEYKRL